MVLFITWMKLCSVTSQGAQLKVLKDRIDIPFGNGAFYYLDEAVLMTFQGAQLHMVLEDRTDIPEGNGAFYYLDEAVLSDIPRNSTQEDLTGKDGILQTSKLHQMLSS
jgi:hypothetical protein